MKPLLSCAVVELAQLSVSLGQEKVDLSGTTGDFSFSLQRKALRDAELFQQRPTSVVRKMLGDLCAFFSKIF